MGILTRLNPEPSAEVIAEAPTRRREAARFRAMLSEVARHATR